MFFQRLPSRAAHARRCFMARSAVAVPSLPPAASAPLSTLSYLPKLKASIPAELATVRRLVDDYESAVTKFRPSEQSNANEVFANNHLRLANIDVVGFDYDYTLCHYTEELQRLIYGMARDYLIKKYRYPSGIEALTFDPSFAIRGLTIDKEKGLLCKISSHQKLCYTGVYRGRHRLSREEIMDLYQGSRHISIEYRDHKMEPLNDLFSVAHACLFADVVQYLIDAGIEYEPIAIVEDVHAAISQVHTSGHMHKAVAKDLPRYVEPSPMLLPFLERIRLFDVVLVSARKPKFYTRNRSFRLLDIDQKQVQWQAVRELKPNHVYTQGSLQQLTRLTGWGGNRVLYIGELEDEIKVQRSPEYQHLAFQITSLEELMRKIQNELRTRNDHESPEFVWQLIDIHEQLQNKMEQMINTNFGSVFRADNYPSQFAFFVQRYVDIYSARLEHLLEYPTTHTFYPERASLPHERN
ncbi:hypothetical protein ATCC90586_000524 [Pythium insidiosum]|nr:hypothetical protein ATCC90586_000524 [Pythium insidiosum]